jgi:hypothetical protein
MTFLSRDIDTQPTFPFLILLGLATLILGIVALFSSSGAKMSAPLNSKEVLALTSKVLNK